MFQRSIPTQAQEEKMQEFRDIIEPLHEKISNEVPNSKARAVALTNLEQALLWLSEAIYNNS